MSRGRVPRHHRRCWGPRGVQLRRERAGDVIAGAMFPGWSRCARRHEV